MRSYLPAYARRIYALTSVQVLGFEINRSLTRLWRLICVSCSSGQHFAYGFLQIPPRDRHPCFRLVVPLVGSTEIFFHLLVCAPYRAHGLQRAFSPLTGRRAEPCPTNHWRKWLSSAEKPCYKRILPSSPMAQLRIRNTHGIHPRVDFCLSAPQLL